MHNAQAAPPPADGHRCGACLATAAQPPPPWHKQWLNFVKAQRHLLNLAMIESLAEAEIPPMHIVQRDETLASIARVRTLLNG